MRKVNWGYAAYCFGILVYGVLIFLGLFVVIDRVIRALKGM